MDHRKEMRSIFAFTEYFPDMGQSGLTGGNIALFEATSALAEVYKVRIFSTDPAVVLTNAAGRFASADHFEGSADRGLRLMANWNKRLGAAYDRAVSIYGKPDALMAVSDTVPLLAAREVRDTKRIALIQAYENFGFFCPRGSPRERWNGLKRSMKTQMRCTSAIQMADLVIVNSRYVDQRVASRFKTPNTQVISPPLSRIFDELPLRTEPTPFAVGFVGRSSGKNLPFVLSLASRMPDVTFKVFGNVTTDLSLPANVRIMGFFNDRVDMYSQARVWIVPSRWEEPFGMVSIEAQASAKAVLVSDRGGLPETVPSHKQVIPLRDRQIWVDRIYEALENPADPDRMFLDSFRPKAVASHWITAVANLFER